MTRDGAHEVCDAVYLLRVGNVPARVIKVAGAADVLARERQSVDAVAVA